MAKTMATRKSRFDHLQFLKKVHECPFLYDVNDVNYKDMVLKEARWTEIGAAFQMSGQIAQQKWKSLRDRFTREKKKYEDLRRTSEEEVQPPKWWLFNIVGKVLDRSSDGIGLITNGDGFEERENGGSHYDSELKSFSVKGEDVLSPYDYHNNNNSTSKKNNYHANNRRLNNNIDTSRSSMCSVDHPESDTANPADGDASTSAPDISSAVHCEVSIDDDDDDSVNPLNPVPTSSHNQHQHNSHSYPYKRKRPHIEETMNDWTNHFTNCLLQRIVDIYPPANNGIVNNAPESMDDVDYYVRSLAPRLRRLKAKDRGLVRLKIESALYEIESAVDE